jgi:hypothetical protein
VITTLETVAVAVVLLKVINYCCSMICLLLLSNITNDPSYDPFPSVSTAVDPKPKTVAVLTPTLLMWLLLLLSAKLLLLNLLLLPQRLT